MNRRISLLAFLLIVSSLKGLDSIPATFDLINGDTLFPVDGKTFDDVESTFGPRIQTSGGNYDWHRGIDIDGIGNEDILAVYDGLFYDYRFSTRGGYTVILRHELPSPVNLLGTLNSRVFYTWYLHLDDAGTSPIVNTWTKYRDDPVNATVVNKGTHIGELGDSGTPSNGGTYSPHLHFELRWGTLSSLEFQLDPENSVTVHNFDPHLHPMLLFEPYSYGANGPGQYLQEIALHAPMHLGQDVVFDYSVNDDMPLLNTIEVKIVPSGGGAPVDSHTLDYNFRTGYDATTLEALDTQNPDDDPYMNPLAFTDSSSAYQTQLIVPSTWIEPYQNAGYDIEVSFTDIWGNTETWSSSLTAVPEPRHAAFLLSALAAGLLLARRLRPARNSA